MTTLEPPNKNVKPMSEKEFNLIRELVYERFGIHLSDQKKTLVTSRLQKLLWTHKFSSYEQYYEYVKKDQSGSALSDLVNKITTNHTFFNREKDHFDFFAKQALPEMIQRIKDLGTNDLRIWCAGCSSGEEAYMLMMLIMEVIGPAYSSWNAGLLATDISERALNTAKAGIYTTDRISTLPPALKHKYFKSHGNDEWKVVDKVRKEVTFRRFNLMNTNFPFKGQFHLIFCRNVMIYFDQKTRAELVNRFAQFTVPGGYLFIGHSESLGRKGTAYEYVMPAVYRKVGA
jgi:chemotaxis protein methyltransferase CheR